MRVAVAFSAQVCPTCSVLYMLPEVDLDIRRAHGRMVFCPSGHETALSESAGENGIPLEQELEVLRVENYALGSRVDDLSAELEEEHRRRRKAEGLLAAPQAEAAPLDQPEDDDWRKDARKECGRCRKTFKPGPKTPKHIWDKQLYCGARCRVAKNVDVAKKRAEGSETAEAPTLEDAAYGGPPAPAEVGEAEPERAQPKDEAWQPGELKAGALIAETVRKARQPPAPHEQRKLPDPRKSPDATKKHTGLDVNNFDGRIPKKHLKQRADDAIDSLATEREQAGEKPPPTEGEAKKLDEQVRAKWNAALAENPELLEAYNNWLQQLVAAQGGTVRRLLEPRPRAGRDTEGGALRWRRLPSVTA